MWFLRRSPAVTLFCRSTAATNHALRRLVTVMEPSDYARGFRLIGGSVNPVVAGKSSLPIRLAPLAMLRWHRPRPLAQWPFWRKSSFGGWFQPFVADEAYIANRFCNPMRNCSRVSAIDAHVPGQLTEGNSRSYRLYQVSAVAIAFPAKGAGLRRPREEISYERHADSSIASHKNAHRTIFNANLRHPVLAQPTGPQAHSPCCISAR